MSAILINIEKYIRKTYIIVFPIFLLTCLFCYKANSQVVYINEKAQKESFIIHKKDSLNLSKKEIDYILQFDSAQKYNTMIVTDFIIPIDTLIKYNCLNIVIKDYFENYLPEFLRYYDQVQVLQIGELYPDNIGRENGELFTLSQLSFTGYKLDNLEELYLISPKIDSVPKSISYLSKLKIVYIMFSKNYCFDALLDCPNLEEIYIHPTFEDVKKISEFASFQNLRKLYLTSDFSNDDIEKLTNLFVQNGVEFVYDWKNWKYIRWHLPLNNLYKNDSTINQSPYNW